MAGRSCEKKALFSNNQQYRVVQRERQKYHRKLRKDDVTNQNRDNYLDVENQLKYISEKEMEDLAANFKKTKDTLILHRIQNAACLGIGHIEAFFHVDGALVTLVSVLCGKDAEKQLEAVTCLTNLACGQHKTTQKIAKAAGAYLVSFLKGESRYLQDQCAWAVGNISNDCSSCFHILNAQGVLPALEVLLQSPHSEVVQSAAFALNMCTQYECSDLRKMIEAGLVNSLMFAMKLMDVSKQTLAYTFSTMSNISTLCANCLNEDELMKMANTVIDHLSKEASSESLDVMLVTPLIRILGGFSTVSDEMCRFMVSHTSFASSVMPIMCSPYHHLKKEMLWVLTNLLVSCSQEKTSIEWQQIIGATRQFLSPLDSFAVQVLYFYCTITTLKPEFIESFKNCGIVNQAQALCDCGKEEIDIAAKTFISLCS